MLLILLIVLCTSILLSGLIIGIVELSSIRKQKINLDSGKFIKFMIIYGSILVYVIYPLILSMFDKIAEHAPVTI